MLSHMLFRYELVLCMQMLRVLLSVADPEDPYNFAGSRSEPSPLPSTLTPHLTPPPHLPHTSSLTPHSSSLLTSPLLYLTSFLLSHPSNSRPPHPLSLIPIVPHLLHLPLNLSSHVSHPSPYQKLIFVFFVNYWEIYT